MTNQRSTITTLVVLFAGLVFTGCTIQTPPELAEAIRDGNINKVQSMLEENPKLLNSKYSPEGETLLHWAVRRGNKELVELLITNGAEKDLKNKGGYTPLDYIGRPIPYRSENHREIAKFLIAKGARCRKGFLQDVLMIGWYDVAMLVIDKGVDVNTKDKDGYTPLHLANNIEFTKLLIARGADVNANNKNGSTPLHMAVFTRKGRKEIVEILIANGADVNSKDIYGQTPLSLAIENDNNDIVELLRKHGAVE